MSYSLSDADAPRLHEGLVVRSVPRSDGGGMSPSIAHSGVDDAKAEEAQQTSSPPSQYQRLQTPSSSSDATIQSFDPRSLTADKVDVPFETSSNIAETTISNESTFSATSSIYDFIQEHGRTYHRYKDGKYFLPNDEREQERLDLQREMTKILYHGRLSIAPIRKPGMVLDLATGTGKWAIEFADMHPESQVLGVDLSPIQPDVIPPNCRFEIDDVEDDWVYHSKFDFIHAGHLAAYIKSFPRLFSTMYDNLNPGGWIEMEDFIWGLHSPDNTLKDTAVTRWFEYVLDSIRRRGLNAHAAKHYRKQLQEAGFTNIVERQFALPIGPWHSEPQQKDIGLLMQQNGLEALQAISAKLFASMGWSNEETELFLMDVRRDLLNPAIHSYEMFTVVYGQKPTDRV